MKWRAPFSWIIGVGAFSLVLRETGCVDLSLYTSESTSNIQSTWTDQPRADGAKPKNVGHTTTIDWKNRTIHMSIHEQGSSVACTTRFTRIDLDGPYWVPLRKSGSASFDAEFSSEDGRTTGVFTGDLALTVTGSCSIRKFKELLLQAAMEQVKSQVQQHF